jgi:3-deoxy-D-manno-octulosonic-acid transferase
LRQLAGFAESEVIFLAGSTQAPEEELALKAFQSLAAKYPKLRLIIVPRHPYRFDEVAALLDRSGVSWKRRSTLIDPCITQSPMANQYSVLLIDTVGELGAWWGTAAIGFVGGSLFSSRGGQNMIEPAAYGVATCFGPNTRNFRDVVAMLLDNNAAICVNNGEELTAFVRRCLTDLSYVSALGQNATRLVKRQQGATERTWTIIEPLLPCAVDNRDVARPAA